MAFYMPEGQAAATGMSMKQEGQALCEKIIEDLPDGVEWLQTPHRLLGGRTPEQAIRDGHLKAVEVLLYSIQYVGAT
jgi:hypothetical protein